MLLTRIIRFGPAVVWMAVIFYLSHQPGGELNSYLPLFQRYFPQLSSFNSGHYIAYFILAITFYWALGERFANGKGRLIAFVCCVLYGITDEIHQMFVPDRFADWMDIRNDAIGALLAMILLSIPPFRSWYAKLLKLAKATNNY